MLGVIAGASMVIGAVIGITQTDMKRMLAYSSVAHAGFILLGVLAMSEQGASATMFYLLTYGMATIGAFAILTVVRKGDGEASHVSDWAGLAKRSPVLAASMSLFLLSFAGIPLTAGFIGKLSVFTAAMQSGYRRAGGAGDGGDRGHRVLLPADRRGHVLLRSGAARSRCRSAAAAGAGRRRVAGRSRRRSPRPPAPVVAPTRRSWWCPGILTVIVIAVAVIVTLGLGLFPGPVLDWLTVPLPLLS